MHDSFMQYHLKWQKTKSLETTWICIIGEYINNGIYKLWILCIK